MESVFRGAAVYLALLLLFRISGKRTLAQITTFDFVVLLIIAEVTQQALLGEDFSVTNCVLLSVTLLGLDIGISGITRRFPKVEKWIDGVPLILVEDGKPIQERMNKSRVDESDIMEAARHLRGLERLDQIRYAVLERSGGITIIPKNGA